MSGTDDEDPEKRFSSKISPVRKKPVGKTYTKLLSARKGYFTRDVLTLGSLDSSSSTRMADQHTMPILPGELNDGELMLELDRFELHPTHHVPTYQFRMVHIETQEVLGNIRLSIGSTPHIEHYAGHIGYGVLPQHRGHHYAARAVRLLLALARQLNLDPLWITCDPENIASRRTLELAGAEFVEIVDVPPNCIIHQRGHPRKYRYRLSVSA